MSEENNTPKWYVVHTYSGYENKVMTSLQNMVENMALQDSIVDIRIPTEEVMEIRNDKKKLVQRKLYPGYGYEPAYLVRRKEYPRRYRLCGAGKQDTDTAHR